jgi:hypothetical protein
VGRAKIGIPADFDTDVAQKLRRTQGAFVPSIKSSVIPAFAGMTLK